MTVLFGCVVIALVAFLLGRELVTWYFKINLIGRELVAIHQAIERLTETLTRDGH